MRQLLANYLLFCAFAVLIAGCATPSQPGAHRNPVFPKGTHQAQKTPGFLLGGSGTDIGTAVSCEQKDSCLLFGQTINSFSSTSNLLAARVSRDGSVQWSRRYGGENQETLTSVSPAANGGALLAGSIRAASGNGQNRQHAGASAHPLVMFINAQGQPLWGGVIRSGMTKILDTVPTPGGGYVLVGYAHHEQTNVDAIAVKLDAQGQIVWARSYDLGANETANAVAAGPDGTLMVTGVSAGSDSKPQAFALALTAQGNVKHSVFYAGQNALYFVAPTGSGFLAAGQHEPSDNGPLLAVKMNAAGQPVWSRTYKSPAPIIPLSMVTGPHENFLLTGRTHNNLGQTTGIAAEFRAVGTPVSDLSVGGKGVVEFLDAAPVGPAGYLIWGDTTLFNANGVDMMGVSWAPKPGVGSDLVQQNIKLPATKVVTKGTAVSLSYKSLQPEDISTSDIKLQ